MTEQHLIEAGLLAEGHELSPEEVEQLAQLHSSELRETMNSAVPRLSDVLINIMHEQAMFRFPGETQAVDAIEAVILRTQMQNTWYEHPYKDGSTEPPDCASADGRTGSRAQETRMDRQGNPVSVFGDCATCHYNAFGSARGGGDGKDCANHFTMVLKVRGREFPMILRAPATSIKPVNAYLVSLANQKLAASAVRTRFTLHQETSKYSVLELDLIERLPPKLFLQVGQMKAGDQVRNLLAAPVATEQPAQLEAPTDVSGHTAQQSMQQEHEPAQQPGTSAGKPGW